MLCLECNNKRNYYTKKSKKRCSLEQGNLAGPHLLHTKGKVHSNFYIPFQGIKTASNIIQSTQTCALRALHEQLTAHCMIIGKTEIGRGKKKEGEPVGIDLDTEIADISQKVKTALLNFLLLTTLGCQ